MKCTVMIWGSWVQTPRGLELVLLCKSYLNKKISVTKSCNCTRSTKPLFCLHNHHSFHGCLSYGICVRSDLKCRKCFWFKQILFMMKKIGRGLTLKVLNFWTFIETWSGWIFDSNWSLKPLCSGMGQVVPARTSPTLPPPSPRTVL